MQRKYTFYSTRTRTVYFFYLLWTIPKAQISSLVKKIFRSLCTPTLCTPSLSTVYTGTVFLLGLFLLKDAIRQVAIHLSSGKIFIVSLRVCSVVHELKSSYPGFLSLKAWIETHYGWIFYFTTLLCSQCTQTIFHVMKWAKYPLTSNFSPCFVIIQHILAMTTASFPLQTTSKWPIATDLLGG